MDALTSSDTPDSASGPRPLVAAAVQFAPEFGRLEENRRRAREAIVRAADRGAQLVVLPELCVSGYVFADLREARALAERLDGKTVELWAGLAAEHQLTIVGGLCECDDDGELRNSAVVVDRGRVAAVYRKSHLWDREQQIFRAGEMPPAVVDLAHGRLGVAVCYDVFFPEVMRTLALAGADVIAVPMNSPATTPPFDPVPIEVSLMIASAAVNRVFVVQADRAGHERGVDWAEASVIVDTDGRLLAGPAAGEALLVGELALGQARDKAYGDQNDVLADRRPELYRLG